MAFVPGVTPDKWARVWAERMPRLPLELAQVPDAEQTAVLYDGRADMCFVRLPVEDERLHVIPLYSEVPVVVVPKEHFVEAAEEVALEDLAGEHVHQVPPLTVKEAVETIAAGVGIIILPMSLARLHNRKDVVHRPVVDAEESRVGLAWRRDLEDDRVETFIGVVRGRRATSSRGAAGGSEEGAKPTGTSPKQQHGKQQKQNAAWTKRPSGPRRGRPSSGRRGRR